jgi:GH25 family lysozyme M1 (1,4-beta-N-acetylmuramidase)
MMHGNYLPPRYNFNRFCHRLRALVTPERRLEVPGITNPQEVRIADTSIYEGYMDAGQFLTTDAQGIIPKASQGIHTDPQFAPTWRNFNTKVPRGCYHFYDPLYSPTAQVNTYVSLVRDDPGELPLVVDWEYTWAGNWTGWSNLYGFLEGLKAAMLGRKIDIYTGYYFWLDHSPNPITQPASLAYFAQFGLWLAWYAPASVVRIPKPWAELEFWQYTSSGPGAYYGADSNAIDLNWYGGTQQQYNETYGAGGPPDPPPGEAMHIEGTVKPGMTVKIRNAPAGAEFIPPRYLTGGDKITASENSAQWLHLTSINGAAVHDTEWSSAGGAQEYIGWQWVADVPPPPPPPPAEVTPHVRVEFTSDDGTAWYIDQDMGKA